MATRAIEEIVRGATPVLHMRRTALADTMVGDTLVSAGEKVVMWYWSANRDEQVFKDPVRFDIERENVNEMVGFGGGGSHFCLGASLARREIQVMLDEIFKGLPDLEITGPPDRLRSPFLHGIKRMPVRIHRAVADHRAP